MKHPIRLLLTLSLLLSPLAAKTSQWKQGVTFLSFLRTHNLPQSLYYNLDADDKEVLAEIHAGQEYYIEEGRKSSTYLIPVTDELQVKVVKNSDGKHEISLDLIPFEMLSGSIHFEIQKNLDKELYTKTHSMGLVKSLKGVYSKNINLNKMKKGDTVTIFYEQKRRKGKAVGNPTILASLITVNKQKYYGFLAEDGKYYDSLGKEYQKVKKFTIPFMRPICNCRISSGYTMRRFHPILRRYKAHLGIDYAAPRGTAIKATAQGKIIFKGRKSGYGNCVEIAHGNGLKSIYAHMSKFNNRFKRGSRVSQGTVIGYVGSTGRSTGPHLHFGMYKNGRPVNPGNYVRVKKEQAPVRLAGKPYQKLRKLVVNYRSKFKNVQKTGGQPLYVMEGDLLIKKKEIDT